MFRVSLKYLYFVHVEGMGRHQNNAWDYVIVIGNHNASNTKRWKSNFCEVEHIGVATKIKTYLGSLQGYDIMSCPNGSETMFILFSPIIPLVVSMGNYRMSTTSTNVTQNSRLQVDNLPPEPSSRPCPFQTQLRIT
jgi:hypothetical protein